MLKGKNAKVLFVLVLSIVLAFSLAACGGGSGGNGGGGGGAPATSGGDGDSGDGGDGGAAAGDNSEGILGANIAVIVNADSALAINDKSWIQKSWEGIKAFGDANGKTYTWYRPGDNSTQGYLNVISTAITSGTEIIISLGFQPQEAMAIAQYDFPDTFFISVDSTGCENDLADNHYAIFHQSDQAGFLAGMAAVKSGYKNIGIISSVDVPPVNVWCWGMVQGINYTAGKEGVSGIQLRQTHLNSSVPSPEAQTMAASWYTDGVDLIICNASGANNSIIAAANAANKAVFGCDVDMGGESEMVQTSAIKKLDITIVDAITKAYAGQFPGASYRWYSVDDDGVGLATANWRVPNYSEDEFAADLNDFINDVDGMKSGIRDQVDYPTLDDLWGGITDKNIDFTVVR